MFPGVPRVVGAVAAAVRCRDGASVRSVPAHGAGGECQHAGVLPAHAPGGLAGGGRRCCGVRGSQYRRVRGGARSPGAGADPAAARAGAEGHAGAGARPVHLQFRRAGDGLYRYGASAPRGPVCQRLLSLPAAPDGAVGGGAPGARFARNPGALADGSGGESVCVPDPQGACGRAGGGGAGGIRRLGGGACAVHQWAVAVQQILAADG